MPLSEFEYKRLEKLFSQFARDRVPALYRDRIRIEFKIKDAEVVLYESRPHYLDKTIWFSTPIARFKKEPKFETWQLYCADRDQKWRLYRNCPPQRDVEKLLSEVKQDPTGMFWG